MSPLTDLSELTTEMREFHQRMMHLSKDEFIEVSAQRVQTRDAFQIGPEALGEVFGIFTFDGASALAKLYEKRFGFEACAEVRQRSGTGKIFFVNLAKDRRSWWNYYG